MTAARVAQSELTELSALLEHEVRDTAQRDAVVHALLASALHSPLLEFLARPGKRLRARLCELGHALGGGASGALPRELPWVIEILHAGSLIVDDIEDDSDERRGGPSLHRLFGLPVALNAGNWLYFWPQRLIARSGLPAAIRLQAHERLGECLLRCHEGQALDLTVRVTQLERQSVAAVVRAITERKTGGLMSLAAALGALAAGAPEPRVDALERFGSEIGNGLQMLDDLSGLINPARQGKGVEDLSLARATWAWAFLAEDADERGYGRLLGELRAARDSACFGRLLEELRFRLGVTGLRHAQRHLEQAVSTLAREVGDGAWRQGVESELRWLTQRFVGG